MAATRRRERRIKHDDDGDDDAAMMIMEVKHKNRLREMCLIDEMFVSEGFIIKGWMMSTRIEGKNLSGSTSLTRNGSKTLNESASQRETTMVVTGDLSGSSIIHICMHACMYVCDHLREDESICN